MIYDLTLTRLPDQALQETLFVSEFFFCNKKWPSESSLFLIKLSSDCVLKYIFEFVAKVLLSNPNANAKTTKFVIENNMLKAINENHLLYIRITSLWKGRISYIRYVIGWLQNDLSQINTPATCSPSDFGSKLVTTAPCFHFLLSKGTEYSL